MVVEQRKVLALLDRSAPYQHIDTDDDFDDEDYDCEEAYSGPIVATISSCPETLGKSV